MRRQISYCFFLCITDHIKGLICVIHYIFFLLTTWYTVVQHSESYAVNVSSWISIIHLLTYCYYEIAVRCIFLFCSFSIKHYWKKKKWGYTLQHSDVQPLVWETTISSYWSCSHLYLYEEGTILQELFWCIPDTELKKQLHTNHHNIPRMIWV